MIPSDFFQHALGFSLLCRPMLLAICFSNSSENNQHLYFYIFSLVFQWVLFTLFGPLLLFTLWWSACSAIMPSARHWQASCHAIMGQHWTGHRALSMEPAGQRVSTPRFPFPRSHSLENPSTKVVGKIIVNIAISERQYPKTW